MNVVEFILSIKDGASHPLGKMAKEAVTSKYSLDQLKQATEKLKGVTEKAGNTIGDVREKIKRLQEMKELLPINAIKQVKEVTAEIEKLEKALEKVEEKKEEGGGSLLPDYAIPTFAFGTAIVESLNKSMERAKEKLNFEILVGKDAGDQLYDGLKKMKGQLGEGIFDIGKELSKSFNANKVADEIHRLGDVAIGDKQKLGVLADAMGQLTKEGKLTEATLGALESGGFQPLVMISETTGESLKKVRARFDEGKVSAQEVQKALEASTDAGGRFYNVLEDLNNSPTGKVQEFKDKLEEMAELIGDKILPIAMEFLDWMIEGLDLLKEPLGMIVDGLAAVFKWIKANREVLEPLVKVIGAFVGAIYLVLAAKAAWIAITTALTTSIEAMSATIMAIPVVGWILAAIAAIIAAIIYLRNNFEGFGEFFGNLWEQTKAKFSIFISYIKQAFNWWMFQHEMAALKIKQFAQYVGGLFANIGRAIKAALSFDFAGAKAALTADIKTSASAEINVLKSKHEADTKGYENERAEAMAKIIAHPLEGIIKRKKQEDSLEATDKATGGRGNKGTLTPGKTDLKNNGLKDNVNAVSGGGVKNITVTVGKMFDHVEFHIMNGTKQLASEIEKIAEEAVTRAIASASAK